MRNLQTTYSESKISVSILIYFMLSACLLSLLPIPASADLAGFQNGDFSNGFTGWSGNLIFTGDVGPSADPHFNLTAQGAQIANDDTDYSVTLFQDFQMKSLITGNVKTSLNYTLIWSPTASEQTSSIRASLSEYDPISQQISNSIDLLQNINTSDLLQGTQASCDVTSLANRTVRMSFTLTDTDFDTPDYLAVSKISFSQSNTTPVPIPAGWTLLISGLAYIAVFRKKSMLASF